MHHYSVKYAEKKYLKNLPKYFSKKKSQNIPFLDSEPLKTPVMRLRQTPAAWLQLVSSDNRRSVTCTENMKDKLLISTGLETSSGSFCGSRGFTFHVLVL